jgi:signal transduction histidine kinase
VTYWHRLVASSGEVRWQQWTDRGLFNEQGALTEIQSVGHDITELKRAESALKQRNEELVALNAIATSLGQAFAFEQIAEGTLDKLVEVLEIAGGWIFVEDRLDGLRVLRLLAHRGLPPELIESSQTIPLETGPEIASTGTSQSLYDIDRILEWMRRRWETALREPGPAWAGVPIQSGNRVLGVLSIFQHNVGLVNRQKQQLIATVGHQLGIALENARLAQQTAEIEVLRELDEMRSELIANVSHELRTPLGLITVCATTLLREDVAFDAETQRSFLLDIVDEAGKLEKIVGNLLDLSRMQSGRMKLDRQPADMAHLVRQAGAALEPQLTNHTILYDLPDQPMPVSVDAKRIEQLLRNLLSNAIKYSPAGSRITLAARSSDTDLLIQISDQGVGIPAQDLERVFERFYRVERETMPGVEGVGLGLAVCRGIVEAHGGRIWAESTLGIGSTFSFTLPMRVEGVEP